MFLNLLSTIPEYLTLFWVSLENFRSILTVFLGIFSLILLYQEFKFKAIKKKMNLDGPKPWPFLGNMYELYTKSRASISDQWGKKYGKIYLIFEGTNPIVCIEDLEIIKQITIRDFEIFPNHYLYSFVEHKYANNLFMLQDVEWKIARSLMTTTFTSSKIKRMYNLFDSCCEDLFECINEQINNKEQASKEENGWTLFRSKETYKLFTLNSITTSCYSVRLERSKGQLNFDSSSLRNKIAVYIDEFCAVGAEIILYILAPEFLVPLLPTLSYAAAYKKLASYLQPLIDERKKKPGQYDDYLSILVDARLGDELQLTTNDNLENHHASLTSKSLHDDQNNMKEVARLAGAKQVMTDDRILANAVLLMAGGMETTATLLRNITYCLAFHPDVQQKLFEQVQKLTTTSKGKSNFLDYDQITACEYLDSVISETLRLYIPATSMDRVAKEDYYIKEYNTFIPKGTIVNLIYGRLHTNPEHWSEPEKFDPERFMPENKHKIVPGSYSPFGLGPRYCIGMRFSLTEAKLALAKIILSYEFKPIPGSPWPPKPVLDSITNSYHPSNVLIRQRQLG